MGSIWKENWKRGAKKNSVSALDSHDLVRVEDLASITGGLGGGSDPQDLSASGFMTAEDIAQSGFVVGPASAPTDGGIVFYDGTSGELVKSSSSFFLSGGGFFSLNGPVVTNNTLAINHQVALAPSNQTANGFLITTSSVVNLIRSTATSGNLPATFLVDGNLIYLKDADGTAGSAPITIDGNGLNIDGDAQIQLVNNYEAVTLLYSGSSAEWHVI